jgi:RNA polymerase sigma-70 factor (ECF subfamily)
MLCTEVLKHKTELTRFAKSLTLNSENSQDLLQETYLRAISNNHRFKSGSNLRAWLFTIMKNLYINQYQKEKKQYSLHSNTTSNTFDRINLQNYNHPEVQTSEKEIRNRIKSLDKKYRIPFAMHMEGYKYKEISFRLSLKLGTVKSRIYNARNQLIETLVGY